ncbi:MAG TPA: hypothetical protein VGN41_21025 [Streptosporangiaceae bacterium]
MIAVTAAAELPPVDGAADAEVPVDGALAEVLADAPEPGELELLLLLQAVAATASATPSADTRTAR